MRERLATGGAEAVELKVMLDFALDGAGDALGGVTAITDAVSVMGDVGALKTRFRARQASLTDKTVGHHSLDVTVYGSDIGTVKRDMELTDGPSALLLEKSGQGGLSGCLAA